MSGPNGVTPMPFIVKATNKTTRNEAWIAAADERGFRTLATRKTAAMFTSLEEAQAAISDTRRALLAAELDFVSESVH
jgi:hypothetical protein